MASYFRSFFGVSQPTTSSAAPSKSRHSSRQSSRPRTADAKSAPVLAVPPSVQPPSNRYSTQAKRPSPLRYDSYDASPSRKEARVSPTQTTHRHPARPPLQKSTTYSGSDDFVHYPCLQQTPSYCSSSSSVYQASSISGHSIASSSANSAPPAPALRRPALKQNHTWSHSKPMSKPHVSFQNPKRSETLNMHPLLASTRHTPAPISYDVLYPPSTSTVVDRSTRSPVPSHTLNQPATDPEMLSQLVLHSDRFPWTIPVQSSSKGSMFYIDRPRKSSAITNLDVCNAVHHALAVPVSQSEWAALGNGSRAQRKASRAYEKRCTQMGGGWNDGVRRVDLLGEKTRLIGVEVNKTAKEDRVAKLIFGRP